MQASLGTRCHRPQAFGSTSKFCHLSIPKLVVPGVRSAVGAPAAVRPKAIQRRSVTVEARGGGGYVARGGGGSNISLLDRAIASVVYLLPFFNSFVYARFLLYMYPALRQAISPLLPVLSLYNSVPFASLIAFFGIYLGIVNNRVMSRFTRFNGMQAALLDILLVLPRLVETIFTPPANGPGLQVYVYAQSFVWIFITAWCAYCVFSCILGSWPRIPYIAEAADQQVR